VRLSEVRADRAANVSSERDARAPAVQKKSVAVASKPAVARNAMQRSNATPAVALDEDATDGIPPALDSFISIGEAARRLGINKSTLSRQVGSGAIRSHDGQVRYSEVLEDRANNINLGKAKGTKSKGKRAGQDDQQPDEPPRQLEMVEVDGRLLSYAEAAQLKENYLAKLRELEFQVKSGTVVDRSAAERTFFEVAREIRDAWLGWPARIATLMASELGIEERLVAETLTRHVEQHLGELGEPTTPDLVRQD
jgi:hypothetical protein